MVKKLHLYLQMKSWLSSTIPCQPHGKTRWLSEKGFNYADFTIKEMNDFCETRVENLEHKEEKKKSSVAAKKSKKYHKKRKRQDSDSSVVESSEESTKVRRLNKKNCILHGKCVPSTDNCKHLRAMVRTKHYQKRRKILETMERATKS